MLRLRELKESDRELFLEASSCEPGCEYICKDESCARITWMLAYDGKGEFTYYIIETESNNFIGYCGVKAGNTPEVCISLLQEYQGQGNGKIALQLLWNKVRNERELIHFVVRVEEDNYFSIKMFEKLGAKKVQTEESSILQNLRKLVEKQEELESVLRKMESFHKRIIQYTISLN